MTTEQDLNRAREAARQAEKRVQELERRLATEESFGAIGEVYVLKRLSIDTGSFQKIEGVFMTESEAVRFAKTLPAYGLNADLFVYPYTLYP